MEIQHRRAFTSLSGSIHNIQALAVTICIPRLFENYTLQTRFVTFGEWPASWISRLCLTPTTVTSDWGITVNTIHHVISGQTIHSNNHSRPNEQSRQNFKRRKTQASQQQVKQPVWERAARMVFQRWRQLQWIHHHEVANRTQKYCCRCWMLHSLCNLRLKNLSTDFTETLDAIAPFVILIC